MPICRTRLPAFHAAPKAWERFRFSSLFLQCAGEHIKRGLSKEYENDVFHRSLLFEMAGNRGQGDSCRLLRGIPVYSRADRREADGFYRTFLGERKASAVRGSQQFGLAALSIAVDGSDRMKDPLRWEFSRAGRYRAAGRATSGIAANGVEF